MSLNFDYYLYKAFTENGLKCNTYGFVGDIDGNLNDNPTGIIINGKRFNMCPGFYVFRKDSKNILSLDEDWDQVFYDHTNFIRSNNIVDNKGTNFESNFSIIDMDKFLLDFKIVTKEQLESYKQKYTEADKMFVRATNFIENNTIEEEDIIPPNAKILEEIVSGKTACGIKLIFDFLEISRKGVYHIKYFPLDSNITLSDKFTDKDYYVVRKYYNKNTKRGEDIKFGYDSKTEEELKSLTLKHEFKNEFDGKSFTYEVFCNSSNPLFSDEEFIDGISKAIKFLKI